MVIFFRLNIGDDKKMFRENREDMEEYDEVWYTYNTILYMKKNWKDRL